MKRRDFVKMGLTSLAGRAIAEASVEQRPVDKILTLKNDLLEWELSVKDQRLASSGIRNKLSGKYYPIREATVLRLTFSAAKERVDIPWWRCRFEPDNDLSTPNEERGYQQGYHQREFPDESWDTSANLCQGHEAITFRGYGWFRARFQLPAGAKRELIVLNLGSCHPTDWKDYWVYVNGLEVGRRTRSGQWETPGEFRLSPHSAGCQALRFGLSEENVLAVRTRGYDRRFGGLSNDKLYRYGFEADSILVDQFVTVGESYLHVQDWEVRSMRQEQTASGAGWAVEVVSPSTSVAATVHYALDGMVRRKWVEVQNHDGEKRLLLDIDLDSFHLEASSQEGGYGYPVLLANEIFCAVEHPSGLNRAEEQRIQLTHFPGKWLEPGERWRSHDAIVGVATAGNAHPQFLDYIRSRSPRKKKMVSLYEPFGMTAWPESLSPSQNDTQTLGTLNLLAEWQKKGVRFDYYVPSLNLDGTSDLKRFRPFSFPDGNQKMIEGVKELGMNLGQWFAVSYGEWSNSRYPKTASCRIPPPGDKPNKEVYRHGYLVGGAGFLCLASEPYFTILKEAVLHHVKQNGVAVYMLDSGVYYCNSTQHEHLPGKYSTEQCYNRLIALTREVRAAKPDVFTMLYGGAYSPFFALHADTLYDIRLRMEGCSAGDYPALFFRDAATQALDQGGQLFARWLPPTNHDSLGVWLPNTGWGNYMGTERWQEALVMDLGRGNMVFPQIWSDVFNLEEEDMQFLARIQVLAQRNEQLFLGPRHVIGDPWEDNVYGYSYFAESHGLVFLNNMSFECRKVKFALDGQNGWRVPSGTLLQMCSHHPCEAILVRRGNADFGAGETVEIQLRPFEVMMIEVQQSSIRTSGLPSREMIETSPRFSYHVPIDPTAGAGHLEIEFADADKLATRGFKKKVMEFAAALPEYAGGRYYVAIVNTFKKDGAWWRYNPMSELVQVAAQIDETVMEFARTPDFRQVNDKQPWIVFSSPLPHSSSGKQIRFGVSLYLPDGVDVTTDLWLVFQWWRPRMRPLPNYWT